MDRSVLYGFILGIAFGISFAFGNFQYRSDDDQPYRTLCWFIQLISFFHFSEYMITAYYHPNGVSHYGNQVDFMDKY